MTFMRECSIVFRRQIRMNLRNPAWVLIGVMQPVLYLLLFGPLLKPLVDQFGAENPYTFLVPGLLIQLGMFGAFFAGFSLIGEWREGVIEAERVTPASRTALLIGRLMRDVLQLLVQALILVGLGYWLGMRGSISGVVVGVLLTLLVGGACAAASNALALSTKSEDVMAPVINMVMMPVLLLSGILLPMTLGPEWLHRLSDSCRSGGSSTRSATPSWATWARATSPGGPVGRWPCSRSRSGGAPRCSARTTRDRLVSGVRTAWPP
jgi:ABC-2 type transport system permease protein